MIPSQRLRKAIPFPEEVEARFEQDVLYLKGKAGEVRKRFFYPTITLHIENNQIILEPKQFTKREKKIINTFRAHIRNMVHGIIEPYQYIVKICSSHFPMTVSVNERTLVIKNFLGEKTQRTAVITDDVDVKVEGDQIMIHSPDKEAAGQTAANFEQATRITNKDRRVFQDGLWIWHKAQRGSQQ